MLELQFFSVPLMPFAPDGTNTNISPILQNLGDVCVPSFTLLFGTAQLWTFCHEKRFFGKSNIKKGRDSNGNSDADTWLDKELF